MLPATAGKGDLMRLERMLAAPVLAAALLFGAGCSEPGPAEKAGKAIDDALEKIQHGDEGPLEKAGRKLDEALEEADEEKDKAK
jgi:hypothetical protein